MTLTSTASTRPVNPPGAKPLTAEQLWAAMAYKARNPEHFVIVIKTCEVLKDEGHKLTRKLTLAGGVVVIEEVSLYEPTSVIFPSACRQARDLISDSRLISRWIQDRGFLTSSLTMSKED
jgi:hypothetical protein